MRLQPQTEPKSLLKNPLVYSTLILLAVAGYVGYILLSRYESKKDYERRQAAVQAQQQRENDRRIVEQLGGTELAVQAFYVSPKVIHPGQAAQLCYDVANAKTVSLDPPAGEVWPSHSRCLSISPKRTTTYTLTITSASGQTVSQSVELKVEK